VEQGREEGVERGEQVGEQGCRGRIGASRQRGSGGMTCQKKLRENSGGSQTRRD
jgi:hypothetical protein